MLVDSCPMSSWSVERARIQLDCLTMVSLGSRRLAIPFYYWKYHQSQRSLPLLCIPYKPKLGGDFYFSYCYHRGQGNILYAESRGKLSILSHFQRRGMAAPAEERYSLAI